MKIKCTTHVDIVGFTIKRNKAHDGKEALVDVELGVTKEFAAKKIGEDFVALAFSATRVLEGEDGGNAIKHLQDVIKPGKNVVLEQHRLELTTVKDGDDVGTIDAQPELLSITPVDGAEKAVAKIRFPVDVSNAALCSALVAHVGSTLKAKFNPAQGAFKFANGDGHDDDAAEAAGAEA